jgi:hypothetical protein
MEQRAWKWYTQRLTTTLCFWSPMGLCHIMVTKTHNSGIPSNNNNNNNSSSKSGSILFIPYTEPTQSKCLIC